MEYIFLLNPYNNVGLNILKQYSGSEKHFILPIAFDWNIKYVKLFDEIDIKKTYLTIGIGSGLRLLEEHLNPIKNLHIIFIQHIIENLSIESYSKYHTSHFNQVSILSGLTNSFNTKISYYIPEKNNLKNRIRCNKSLYKKIKYLLLGTINYFKSISNIDTVNIRTF